MSNVMDSLVGSLGMVSHVLIIMSTLVVACRVAVRATKDLESQTSRSRHLGYVMYVRMGLGGG